MKTQRMSGKALQKSIIDLAHLYNWKCAHFQSVLATRKDGSASWRTPVQADGKGFPDVFMVRDRRALAVEVKGDGDTVKPEQAAWHYAIGKTAVEMYVWTPESWRNGAVESILR